MRSTPRARKSLSRRITTQFALLMLIVAILVGFVSYMALENTYLRLYNEKAQDIVRTLAAEIDGDRLHTYVETGTRDEYYDELQEHFDSVKSHFTGIQYLYLFYPEDTQFIYIIDAFKEGDDPANISSLGDVYVYRSMELTELLPDVKAGRASTELIRGADVGFGKTISAWAPVFDSSGKVAAMVEADCLLANLTRVVQRSSSMIVFSLVLMILVVLALVLLILRRGVTLPIRQLTRMVDSYEHGEIADTHFRFDDEVQWLGTSFTDMTHRIEAYTAEVARVTAEKERIGAELSVAAQIQADMLPRIFPPYPDRKEFDLYATMTPAKEVGGDFYDFFLIDHDHIGLVMADVSGKGVPAALFMVIAKTLIKTRAQQGGGPAEILRDVNEKLCEGNEAELFVTVWLGILQISTGKGLAANAGHEHPVIRRKDGKYELVVYRHAPAVATLNGIRFREHSFELYPGDTLFVYTDGVPEATNIDNELFGTDRMLATLNSVPDAGPKELLMNVKKSIDQFVGSAPQFDDITMMGLQYNGPAPTADRLHIPALVENLDDVLAFVDTRLEAAGCSMKTQMQIDVSVEELFVNVANYAYAPDSGDAELRLEVRSEPKEVVMELRDWGRPFNPLEKPDPDVTLSAAERNIGGLGIFLAKKNMDKIAYRYEDGQNILTFSKAI